MSEFWRIPKIRKQEAQIRHSITPRERNLYRNGSLLAHSKLSSWNKNLSAIQGKEGGGKKKTSINLWSIFSLRDIPRWTSFGNSSSISLNRWGPLSSASILYTLLNYFAVKYSKLGGDMWDNSSWKVHWKVQWSQHMFGSPFFLQYSFIIPLHYLLSMILMHYLFFGFLFVHYFFRHWLFHTVCAFSKITQCYNVF